MQGKVKITVESTSAFAGTLDTLRFAGSGEIEKTEYGYHLRYHAENEQDKSPIDSDVKLETKTKRAVVINEAGENGYGLLLDPAAMTATQIDSGADGKLLLNVKTNEVGWEIGKKQGSILLDYALLIGAQPVSALRVKLDLQQE